MLTILCGEDVVASRNQFQKVKEEYKNKGYEIVHITDLDPDKLTSRMTESNSLFEMPQLFCTEHLVKSLKLKRNKSVLEKVDALIKNKGIVWYDWESYTAREITNPKAAQIIEYKPSTSIFMVLDECYPGNLHRFLSQLATVTQTQDEGFVYAMLCKHIRTLILAKSDSLPSSTPPWQRGKLASQARIWTMEKLVSFYEGLARIDISVKTSGNPYGIKKSLDIMACYLL